MNQCRRVLWSYAITEFGKNHLWDPWLAWAGGWLHRLRQHAYYRWLLGFGTRAFVFGVMGWLLDNENHFWFHLCVELCVALGMLVVTVLIVERMLEHQRRVERKRQWEVVRESTVGQLVGATWGIAFTSLGLLPEDKGEPYLLLAPEGDGSCKATAKAKVVGDMEKLEELLRTECCSGDFLAPRGDGTKFLEWRDENRFTFGLIRNNIVPRFIQFAPDHAIMKDLLELESDIVAALEFAPFGKGADMQAFTISGFVPDLVKQCRLIYEQITPEK